MSGSEPLDIILRSDGRDLDQRIADAAGIAARQTPMGRRPDRPVPGAGTPIWTGPARTTQSPADTYYDQPVVKAPPWGGKVSAYIVLGGVAGSSAALGAAAQVLGGGRLGALVRSSRALSALTATAGAGLLMADLGRPDRFLHMMRLVRPTSVMNVGGYCLSTTAGASAWALVLGGRCGRLGRAGRAAGVVAGIAGIPLCGYTGVLLSATAMPGWNVGTRTLPPLFMASAAATSAPSLRLAPVAPPGQRALAVLAATAQAAELAAEHAHERTFTDRPHVRACYQTSRRWRAGRALTLASLALGLAPPTRRTRTGRAAAGVLGVAGSTLTKTAVYTAGLDSARDPRAVGESG